MRTVSISALNVAMHKPHSAKRYVELFEKSYELKLPVMLGKLHGAILGMLILSEQLDAHGTPSHLMGEIYRFVNLDPSLPWFNFATKKKASQQDVREISIPKHLLPHLQRIPFIFLPKSHRLVFIAHDRKDRMAAGTAVNFFDRLFGELLKKGFPEVTVTAIVEHDALEKLLAIPKLERLTIELSRPNPDDLDEAQAKFMKKLEQQKARKQTTQLFAAAGESLKPDAETKAIAEVAANNGRVSAIGRDLQGNRIEDSTSDRPLVLTEKVDDKIESTLHVLQRVAHQLN